MTEPVRDPGKYRMTKHASNQKRHRGIGQTEINNAIKMGKYEPEAGDEEHEAVFRLEFPGVDVLAVVDEREMAVETVMYDDEQGAEGGSIGGGRFRMLGKVL